MEWRPRKLIIRIRSSRVHVQRGQLISLFCSREFIRINRPQGIYSTPHTIQPISYKLTISCWPSRADHLGHHRRSFNLEVGLNGKAAQQSESVKQDCFPGVGWNNNVCEMFRYDLVRVPDFSSGRVYVIYDASHPHTRLQSVRLFCSPPWLCVR